MRTKYKLLNKLIGRLNLSLGNIFGENCKIFSKPRKLLFTPQPTNISTAINHKYNQPLWRQENVENVDYSPQERALFSVASIVVFFLYIKIKGKLKQLNLIFSFVNIRNYLV